MSFFLSVVVKRDETLRALGRARLWEPAGNKQVLHKLKKGRVPIFCPMKSRETKMDLWPQVTCMETDIV